MNEVREIEKEISIIREKYLKSAIDILSDYNTENGTRDDYKRRQIYELLQNADDCYTELCPEINVKFELRDNLLIVQNTGEPFSARGITSLMHPNASSKHQGTIGCKGLGFRAVLNWASSITICTKAFCVRFSEERAREDLEKYKQECDRDHIEELDRIDRTAILSSAMVTDDMDEINLWLEEGYSTAIVLYCHPDCIASIQQQLAELQFEELLFLKHIRNISIRSPQANRDIQSVEENGHFLIQDGDDYTEWTVWRKTGKISDKDYELALAYNSNSEEREAIRRDGVLYSYFKTEIPMPFPFLIHGTFELTSERNGLKKESKNNEMLLQYLIDFICEKGVELAESSENCDYDLLKFLIPAHTLYFLDREYDFGGKLKEKIRHYKLFPTIAGKYISVDDSPKYSNFRFDEIVSTQTFSTLLLHCEDETVLHYIGELGIGFYDEATMVAMLNKDADDYTEKKQNVSLILLFRRAFPYAKSAPKLLIDSNGNRVVEDEVTIYHNPDKHFELPAWCKMRFISLDMEKALCRAWRCDPRSLMQNLSGYGGAEYSFDRVLRELISQSKNDKEKTLELLRWLFDTWERNDQQFETGLTRVNVQAVSREGDIVPISKMFFGHEYGNDVGERIASCLKEPIFLADLATLGFDDGEKETLKKFLSQLGAKSYPAIESRKLSSNEFYAYKKYNSSVHATLFARGEPFSYDDFFYHEWGSEIQLADIVGISEILQKANYKDILYWIWDDEQLRLHIRNKNEVDDSSYMRSFPYKKKESRTIPNDQMRSWLRRKFVETDWLPAKSKARVNCKNCTMQPHELSPVVEVLDIDYAALSEMCGRPMKKEVEAILESLDVAEDVPNLPYEKIYEILLKLPEIDVDCTMGKSIYTKINLQFDSNATNRLIANNRMYEQFKREGRVLAEIGGKCEYRPVHEVFYVGRKTYSEDILKNYPVLALNRRAGDDKVQRLFCVKSIKNIGGIQVTPVIHPLNDAFQADYLTLLPYIYAKRMGVDSKNKELNALKNSKILLVSEAHTEHIVNGEPKYGVLKDYEIIYTDKIAYIKIPRGITTLAALKAETKFSSAAAEVITTILDIDRDTEAFMIIFERKSLKDIEMYFQTTGDQTLSVLNLAKEKFSQQIDYEYEFWSAVSAATGFELDDLKNQYSEMMPDDFDYRNLNDLGNLGYIVDLFIKLGIDVGDYNETAFVKIISVKDYFESKVPEYKRQNRDKYLCLLAKRILATQGDKKDFEEQQRTFEFYAPDAENSVTYDVAKAFENEFGYSAEDLQRETGDYAALVGQLPEREIPVPETQPAAIPAATHDIDYKKLYGEIAGKTDGTSIKPEIASPAPHEISKAISGHGKHGGTVDRGSTATKELDGFKAEAKVYETLKCKIGDSGSVEWVSGNGEQAGECTKGNDGCGYDIRYTDLSGKVHYVEVKGTSSENLEFILSRNEMNFAQAHKDQYELWFVFIKNGEPGEPLELGNIFVFDEGEDFFQNHRFSVEQNDFKLRAKIL